MNFEFATATRIIFGAGALAQAPALAKEFGRRALVTTGRDPKRAGRLLESLRQLDIHTVPFAVDGEPDVETVRQGAALATQERCDLVISFGGGSALDAGKAIAVMLTNDGDILDYLEVIGGGKILSKASLPFLAMPTTAGTGSEVTRNAVLASPKHRLKVSLRSPFMLAKAALIDPELTWDLPPAVTASSGMDALTQLIEPYVCKRANPLTDSLCRKGIVRVARSLRVAFKDGHNAAAREDMAVASVFGGMALSNAALGAVHGLAGAIGGWLGAPHGVICAALLPQAMAANIEAMRSREGHNPALFRYEVVARLLTGRADATAEDGVTWIAELTSDLQIPKLGVFGLRPGQSADFVEKSKSTSSMKANPIQLTNEELAQTVHAAI